mmetsp:Transcript_59789/g.99222  ORF Transcript_59789/g.99222 Transcript_59789/m.99222 type:complete len:82 (-) Transcript_59789:301-546(-)
MAMSTPNVSGCQSMEDTNVDLAAAVSGSQAGSAQMADQPLLQWVPKEGRTRMVTQPLAYQHPQAQGAGDWHGLHGFTCNWS